MSSQNKFSANELAKELTRLNQELIPLQNEIASFLEERDKISEYKKDIMTSMMKTYCDLRNKIIDIRNKMSSCSSLTIRVEHYYYTFMFSIVAIIS